MGAWIETLSRKDEYTLTLVAPYVGAWIETVLTPKGQALRKGRTLRGCVD